MSNETNDHVHAEQMAQYAEDARTNAEPWKLWRKRLRDRHMNHSMWSDLASNPTWQIDVVYERKPRTITINGFEVPEPLREAVQGQIVWTVDLSVGKLRWVYTYPSGGSELALSRGLCHATQEAAVAHANALLSFTERKE